MFRVVVDDWWLCCCVLVLLLFCDAAAVCGVVNDVVVSVALGCWCVLLSSLLLRLLLVLL